MYSEVFRGHAGNGFFISNVMFRKVDNEIEISWKNENLYNNYKELFDRYSKLQRDVYELMFRNGWYCLEKAEMQKINSKIKMLSQELTDLS